MGQTAGRIERHSEGREEQTLDGGNTERAAAGQRGAGELLASVVPTRRVLADAITRALDADDEQAARAAVDGLLQFLQRLAPNRGV